MSRLHVFRIALYAIVVPFVWSGGSARSEDSKPRLIIDPRGPGGQTWELVFTPDGETLVSLGTDKAIRFWDVGTGELRKTMRLDIEDGPEGKFYAGVISPDGKWFAVGGRGTGSSLNAITVFDLEKGRVATILKGHDHLIFDLAFSRDSRWLASGSWDSTVRIWDLAPLPGNDRMEIKEAEILKGHTAGVSSVSFSPDGQSLVSGSFDHTLILWKRAPGSNFQSTATLKKHTGEVGTTGFSRDGRYILSGARDRQLLQWDGRSGAFLKVIESDMESNVLAISFSPDGGRFFATSQSSGKGFGGIYRLESGERLLKSSLHDNTVLSSAWHPNGDLLATCGGSSNEIKLWQAESGEVIRKMAGDGMAVATTAFGNGGLQVAFGQGVGYSSGNGNWDDLERVFDFASFALSDLDGDVRNPAGFQRTIQKKGDHQLNKTDSHHLETGSGTINHIEVPYDYIRSFSFTPDGNVVVGSDFSLVLYSATGEQIRKFIGHDGSVWGVSPSPDGRYLATASRDQTVRLWNLQTGALLASLFVARDGEWVCWAPSGHYHASAGGEKYIGWHLNKGGGEVAEYYPSYVFREQFHHPQLVKRTVLLGDFDKALAEVGDTNTTNLAEVLPPRIDWILPAVARGQSAGGGVTVKANISSPNAGLEEVKLLVNGKAVKSDFRVSGNSLSYEQTIDLLPGENRLSLFARNSKAGHTSDERVVTVASTDPKPLSNVNSPINPSDLDDLLKPNLYVLAVGVSNYEVDTIPALQYCDDDAKAIAEFFRGQENGIFGKVEVKLMTDEGATEREVQSGLDWLEENATQKDVVILFLAAHGINDDKGNFYLLPHDADVDSLRSTAVAWDDFGDILGNLPSRVLMFLDTCHSGQLGAQLFTLANVDGARTRSAAGLRSAFDPTEAIRELTSDENGVIIMAASTGDEESVETDEWGHGAFTMGLLEGFKGKADVNQDGIVHLRELDFFVAEHVKLLTGGRQHPTTVKPSTISRLPVARVR